MRWYRHPARPGIRVRTSGSTSPTGCGRRPPFRAIAAELGRSPSTISREIRRNRTGGTRGQWHYLPHAAQARANARRPRPKHRKTSQNPELRDAVQAMPDEKWSPEQIFHALRQEFPDRPEIHVVHETVTRPPTSRAGASCGASSPVPLRSGRARRRLQRQANCRQPRFTTPMVMTSERPAEAADRAVRDFTAPAPGKYMGDITYLPTGDGQFLYLATVLDCFSRRVVGWSIAAHMRTELVADALRIAAATRGGLSGAVFHSDHGAQYTSREFADLCGELDVIQSMGAVGTSADNAACESFHATLKRETLRGAHRYPGTELCRRTVFR